MLWLPKVAFYLNKVWFIPYERFKQSEVTVTITLFLLRIDLTISFRCHEEKKKNLQYTKGFDSRKEEMNSWNFVDETKRQSICSIQCVQEKVYPTKRVSNLRKYVLLIVWKLKNGEKMRI